MKRLRYIITSFLFASVLLLHIESLSLAGRQYLTLTSSESFLLVLSVLSIILLPFWGKHSVMLPLIIWLCGVSLLKVGQAWPLPLEITTVQAYLVQLATTALLVFLAHRLSLLLCQFEAAVEDVALNDQNLQRYNLSSDMANQQVHLEFMRARDGERPLSLLLIEPAETGLAVTLARMLEEIQQAIVSRYTFLRMVKVIRRQLRVTDLVWQEQRNRRLVILCPESDHERTTSLLQAINLTLQKQLGVHTTGVSATFPDEGFTFDGLMASAEKKLATPLPPQPEDNSATHESHNGDSAATHAGTVPVEYASPTGTVPLEGRNCV